MRQFEVTAPEVAFFAATRGALGLGAGLLLSRKVGKAQRQRVGWGLVALGLLTTIPAARHLFHQRTADAEAHA